LAEGEFAEVTRGEPDGPAYFAMDLQALRIIVLDTVNPHGGWQGSIDSGPAGLAGGRSEAASGSL
jgi:hypothetical protein